MPYYRRLGEVPHKRHTQFRKPDGSLYAEHLMGEEGFSAESALLYREASPAALVDAKSWTGGDDTGPSASRLVDNDPLLPRHLRTHDLPGGGDLVTGRHLLMGNEQVRLSYVAAEADSPLYRDSTGDQLVYVESGSATLLSEFGVLPVGEGDYVQVPAGTTSRWLVGDGGVRAFVVEARGHVVPPDRYLSDRGQFLEHSPYCERDLRGPQALVDAAQSEAAGTEVLVRHRGGLSTHTYATPVLDVVGWDGCLYPYALSISDFEPVVGRVHQPPPVHQTFEGPGFVICSFVPRLFDFHPEAVPVPYHHANVDSDEVLFYTGGDFMSRAGSGIGQGSISLHPAGFVHGPQPGSAEKAIGKAGTDEVAVMVDTFAPLQMGPAASGVEAEDYPWTWARAAAR